MTQSKMVPLTPPSDPSSENNFVLLLVKNKQIILLICVAILLIGTLFGWMHYQMDRAKVRKASLAYASLDESNGLQNHADLKQVKKIADQYSFLQAHLDAPLAQESLNQKDLKVSEILLARVESRLSPNLSILFESNQISLLVAKGEYQKALDASYLLNEKMNPNKLPTLYKYHILRTMALEKKLCQSESYQKTLKECAASNTDLTLGQLSLKEYLTKNSL